MPASPTTLDINYLKRGSIYRVDTRDGVVTGEYLGIETPFGEWSILIRRSSRTESISLRQVTSVYAIN
jgi:hypothetical protein